MSLNIDQVIIVGAGPMAVSYAQVLRSASIPAKIIGRSESSAAKCSEQTGIRVVTGGLRSYLNDFQAPLHAIIATGVDSLEENTIMLLESGCKNILVEKPGALNKDGLKRLLNATRQYNGNVYIAYNRRFYASVNKARPIIEEDGGLREVYFEFTEWSHIIESLPKEAAVKSHWFLANSTHVVDLAFHFAGLPSNWQGYVSGGNSWHNAATRFVGSGITSKDVLFTYQADWEGPGRWGLELVTKKRRLFLRPLEQLSVQESGSVTIQKLELDDEKDTTFKPGLYAQVMAWLNKNEEHLCSAEEQWNAMDIYYKMAGY